MTTTEHPVRQLLWCALNALKTAQENHNITSETGLRLYLLEWLSGASRHPEFRSPPWRNHGVSIDRKRSQYSHHRNAEYALSQLCHCRGMSVVSFSGCTG
uniref:Conjugal transfer protein TraC n=1 Tax=Escherichia coli TaxID=562 RepID=A0A8F1IF38_ECOLX|nr:hypothetical protein IHCLGBEB_00185 [Escherichia coli]